MAISAVDLYQLEKQLGAQAATSLRSAFKQAIQSTVKSTGDSRKATVTAKYKQERLDRLTFSAPHYIYKQNYGFEGTKKNGVKMRLKATDVLSKAINNSGVLEKLADGITDIRAEQVFLAINFKTNGR